MKTLTPRTITNPVCRHYVNKCGLAFSAVFDSYQSPIGWQQFVELLSPPLDTGKASAMPMVQYLSRNQEAGTVEGILFPENTVSGLQLLRENCRAIEFHSCSA